jgi:hypothetical protein
VSSLGPAETDLICDEKDRFLPNVVVAGDNLHDNGIIEASAEHPMG